MTGVDLLVRQQRQHPRPSANVGFDEAVVGRSDLAQQGQGAGVGQLVDVDDLAALADQADDRAADEAGAAGDEDSLHDVKPVSTSARRGRRGPCPTGSTPRGRSAIRWRCRDRRSGSLPVMLAAVGRGDLVLDLAVRLERQEAVGETLGDEHLVPLGR